MKPSHLFLLSLLVACGDDVTRVDADAGAVDGGAPDATPVFCPQSPATAVIGPEGGELELCGAFVRAAEGVLEEDVELTIEVAESPPEPDPPRELAGAAFRFTADGGVVPPAALEIGLPHGGAEGRLELYAVEDGELFGFEACDVDDATITQFVALLGTFVATVDTYPYAESPDDLGDGTISADLGDRDPTYAFPGDGFVIDESYARGVALNMSTDILEGPDGAEQLRLNLFVPEDGEGDPELIFAQWYYQSQIWQAVGGVVEITSRRDDRIAGTLSASMFLGEATMPFTATFDLAPAYWAYPPSRVCPGGKKPPP